MSATRQELELDLLPFRAAIEADVDSLMTAHVVYEALDGSTAATLSHAVLTDLLRAELRFNGLVVSDALIMEGMLQAAGGSEIRAAIEAVNAGCDALLYPSDLRAIGDALESAAGDSLRLDRIAEATARIEHACARLPAQLPGTWHDAADRAWSEELAVRSCTVMRGSPHADAQLDLLTIDDDLGGPFAPPPRDEFAHTLRADGIDVTEVTAAAAQRALCIAVYSDVRAWKGAPGLTTGAAEALRAAVEVNADACIVLFGHPRLGADLPGHHVLAAWGGEALMQRAAARWLTRVS